MTIGWRPYGALLGLCLVLFLPGIVAIPAFDRDESRTAQAARQMLESGDYIRIRNQDEIRAKKPAGIYWLQAAAARLSGAETAIWPYRLPSVAGACLAVLLTYLWGKGLVGPVAALVGASLLASSVLLVNEAHLAKTDAVLLACVVAAQGALGRLYVGAATAPKTPSAAVAIFWIAQGLGILVKGPVVPIISLLTIAGLAIADRSVRWLAGLQLWRGLLVVAVIVGPWVWAISRATDGQFIGQAVKTDLLPKLFGAQESHGAPPTYYLVLLILTFWPGSLFVIPALWRAAKHRHEPATRFCLAWIVPSWIMFEAIPTKLPHYVLPLYPALALLAGILVAKKAAEHRAWVHQFALVWGLIGMGLGIAILITPVRLASRYPWWFGEIAVLALASGLLPAKALRDGRPRLAYGLLLAGAVATDGALYQAVLPTLDRLWISRNIAAMIPAGAAVAAAGYHEESLVFALGTNTLLTDGPGAAQFLAAAANRYAIVDQRVEPAFDAGLAKAGLTARAVATLDGYDYTHGRSAHITVWQAAATP